MKLQLFTRIVLALLVVTILFIGSIHAQGMEYDTDRGGSDYKNFDLTQADPALCQTSCSGEAQCKAWTYVKPGIQGPQARCWLKTAVPAAKPSGCCVSGVKGVGSPVAQTVTIEAKGNSVTGGSPQTTGITVAPGQLLELSADPAATWTAGVGLPEWTSTANGVNYQITVKGFTFPVGALVGSVDGGTTFFLVGTQLKLPVQTAGTLQLYFWDADAANNGGAIQLAVKVSACPPSIPGCVGLPGAKTVTVEAKANSVTGGSPQNTGITVAPGQLLELSADPAATWIAGVGMPEWSSTANGVQHTKITVKGFTFPVGALVGSVDGGTTFFLVGTQLKLPVQTAGTLQLYFWDTDAANNDGAIQVAVKVSACPSNIPDCVESHSCQK